MFNPIPSSEADPLAWVDAAHPPLTMCVAALFETAGKGSAGTLLADKAICKVWGVTGHRPNPPPINASSSSYGHPPRIDGRDTPHACNGWRGFVQNGRKREAWR